MRCTFRWIEIMDDADRIGVRGVRFRLSRVFWPATSDNRRHGMRAQQEESPAIENKLYKTVSHATKE
jgi:hypothetical protein